MRIIRTSEVEEKPNTSALMTGGAVTAQAVIPDDVGVTLRSGIVNFARGARNKFHSHTSDQLLIITSGIGIVATEHEQREVTVGDIVHIPPGEKHWHGARKESPMSHINVTATGSETTQLED